MSDVDRDRIRDLLTHGDLSIVGHLSGASNATLACAIHDQDQGRDLSCVYKPRRGERPLWDFATGSLGHREVASSVLDEFLGWNLVPITVWRVDGPLGAGMCQIWIDDDPDQPAVDVVSPDRLPPGWLVVLEARTYDGQDVVLAHEDSDILKRMCVFDLVANNADRKGGHVLRDPSGRLVGIDHGLTFHAEPKLRTVLWGWAGSAIDENVLDDLCGLRHGLESDDDRLSILTDLLSPLERIELLSRVTTLLDRGRFPTPESGDHPALPWPPM